jgi:hypothetical protein
MSNPKWSGYFKVVKPDMGLTKMTDSQEMSDAGAYNNYTWYQRLVQGSASRMTRYREYDLMDNDVEVSRALDTIAEEITGNDPKTDEPIQVALRSTDEKKFEGSEVMTVRAALDRWNFIHDWENRLFKVSRMVIKYGDAFFRKNPDKIGESWVWIHPKNVIAAVVHPTDANKVVQWQVKKDAKKVRAGYGMPIGAKQDTQYETELVDAREMVRFTLNDDMSDTSPFGESVLRPVYRAHKQKELLEDAIIIYRVQRAPERRVFYIDVGKMAPMRVKTYIEGIKNEIKQKKVPTNNGGQSEVDSVYNPQSMSEDFFFASRPDGKGSRVETLPGGAGLGELSDLEYFQRKVWRGLRVPASYMVEAAEGGAMFTDGKVGQAYIQELRFAMFVSRIQSQIEVTLDAEFKSFLQKANIRVDPNLYRLRLPAPSNFGMYKQQELDAALLGTYSSADGIPYMSKRFAMERFLQMRPEEISRNEVMAREEKGIDANDNTSEALQKLYGGTEEGADMGMGMGGGLGGLEGSMGPDMGIPGAEGEPAAGGADAATDPTGGSAPQPPPPTTPAA